MLLRREIAQTGLLGRPAEALFGGLSLVSETW
jgi:hypothetical protein